MGRRVVLGLMVLATAFASPAAVRAQEGTSNIEFVKNVPLEAASAIGGIKIGNIFYLTGTSWFSIYDVTDPLDPQMLSHVPLGFQWENEDVSSNGRILLISETGIVGTPVTEILHVWDVTDPKNPTEIGRGLMMGDHTSECLFDCKWSYGSEGTIVDLSDPANPQDKGSWIELSGFEGDAHDVEEVRPGLVAVSSISTPWVLMDVTDPLKPQIVASTEHPDPSWLFHSIHWPNKGQDRWVIAQGEGSGSPILTYKSVGTPEAPRFELVDTHTTGSASAHWFDHHPKFRDGGLLAAGWYAEGMRVLQVPADGDIREVGYFKPEGLLPTEQPSTWGAYWITDNVIYSVDNRRGLDVLKWTGPIPLPEEKLPTIDPNPPATPAVPYASTRAAAKALKRVVADLKRRGLGRLVRGLKLPKDTGATITFGKRVIARGTGTLRATKAGRRVLRRPRLRVTIRVNVGSESAQRTLTLKRR